MDVNLTTFTETLQRYNWSLKCDPGYVNCTIETALNFSGIPNGTDHLFPRCERAEMAVAELIFMILYAAIGIVGILGNTLVIYVVLRFSNMQVSSRWARTLHGVF